jgi:biopolymer transport protein TolQ
MWFVDALSSGIAGMILHAGPVAKAVMAILFFFSTVSWSIIFFKIRQYRRLEREGTNLLPLLEGADSLKKLATGFRSMRDSPYYRLLFLVYRERGVVSKENPGHERKETLDAETRIRFAIQEENERLERYLSFLATTANTAPFVGLFGTVWGIMDSFREIGIRGTTSLAVVAPGISEALIATAFGLATAIPAVIGYNYLLGRSRRISSRLENFATYILALSEK